MSGACFPATQPEVVLLTVVSPLFIGCSQNRNVRLFLAGSCLASKRATLRLIAGRLERMWRMGQEAPPQLSPSGGVFSSAALLSLLCGTLSL
jgi:hypothetical protein